MSTPTPPHYHLFSSVTLICGLAMMALGVAGSCASSPIREPTPRPAPAVSTPTTVVIQENQAQSLPSSESSTSIDQPAAVSESSEPQAESQDHDAGESLGPSPTVEENRALAEEVRSLYRRLHIELPPERRSALIIELLNDPRTDHRMLGFELADRDLSASVALDDAVGHAMHTLIADDDPRIRANAARLITRLVPPDAMLVLTRALQVETESIATEPMLMGIARWPNLEAKPSVLEWLGREDAPKFACFSAAWSIEREGYWDSETEHPIILEHLRAAAPRELREDGMRLLARLGSADDLRRLTGLMLSEDRGIVRWSASALVETPRAVDVLAQAATENEVFYQAAAEAMINHRATPDGLRRLSEIPQSDANVREESLLRLGQKINREQLGEAVRLAQLEPEISIGILSRLISSEESHTARSAKGVIQLAQLQLNAGRPNRAIEALLSIDGAPIDPPEKPKLDRIKTLALLLLGRLDEAAQASASFAIWREAIDLAAEPVLKSRIAARLINLHGDALTEEQSEDLNAFLDEPTETPPTETEGDE